jgi:methionyl aminopeptidase
MNQNQITSTKKAGQIVATIRKELPNIIKKDTPLLEIAEKIEQRITELGGKPAFPTNLSINEIAAHYTPIYNDETLATGLLKVDFGVHIDGFTADNSMSFDLEDNSENKKLILAAEACVNAAIQAVKSEAPLGKIGAAIQEAASSSGFSAIQNLSGHSIDQHQLHSGITIPNYDNNSDAYLPDGVYAIEPFVTTGQGMVYDGKPSGIYEIRGNQNVRDPKAREILNYITEEYGTLPFCSRWLVKKFGTRALIALSQIKQAGTIHEFNTLVEKSKAVVAQAEHTLILQDGKVEVVTE